MLLLISTYLRPRRVAHSITSSVRAARHSPSLECPDNPLAGTDSTSKLRSDGLAMVDDTLLRRKWCSVDEEFAPDSPLEGTGFEPVWGFSCQAVIFGLLAVLCSERERPFFVPSPTIRFAERAEGVKGPKR
jgi:hypothetical protein